MKQDDQGIQLDAIDRRILRILQQRGDISHAELAQEVAASPASCWRRIKALETAGVLGSAVRLVDQDMVGRALDVLCQIRVKSHDPAARQAFEAFVAGHDEVMECYSMTGDWDYMIRVVVDDVRAYEHFLMRELLAQTSVASASSHFALKRIKYTTALPV